jgi:phosphatidate cytidylyltransferase
LIVPEPEPLTQRNATSAQPLAQCGNLLVRVISALVLAPAAIAVAYVGGWLFTFFWAAAAAGIIWEWFSLVDAGQERRVLAAAGGVLMAALVFGYFGRWEIALDAALLGAVTAALLAPPTRRGWLAAGTLYASIVVLAPMLLRADPKYGFSAIIFLFAVVWGTDVFAYFVGRSIGGPKLVPSISPNKTWSGAIGGSVAAMCVGGVTANLIDGSAAGWLVLVALAISIISQVGDLFESWVKRRFAAKNSSELIPGHGGLMDRLDGFIAAALAGALIGIVRGGLDAPARGLMLW